MASYNNENFSNKGLRVFPKFKANEYRLKLRITARNNHLIELPYHFSKLSFLNYLNLSNNKFEDIPSILAKNGSLKELILDNNNISDISELVNISTLKKVSLNSNSVSKIPTSIHQLKSLTDISLSKNSFSSFPESLCKLDQLQKLDISNNNFLILPQEIANLKELTHLNLSNTGLRKFPKEILGLKKLKELKIEGNPFTLPKSFNPLKPQDVFEEINRQEEFAKLKTTKAFIFKNLCKDIIIKAYDKVFENFTQDKGIDIVYIESLEDIHKNATVVFIIIGFDIHNNSQLVYDVIKRCISLDINYLILKEEEIIGGHKFINLVKGAEIDKQHKELVKGYNITSYSQYEELKNIIFNAVNQRPPKIKFRNIKLSNIGHFGDISIPLSSNICCLVGENGTGKSTVLKAIALASIGADFDSVDKNAIYDLLKILSLTEDGYREYKTGYIRLDYEIDGDGFYNEIIIQYSTEEGIFSIRSIGDYEITTTGINIKSLDNITIKNLD